MNFEIISQVRWSTFSSGKAFENKNLVRSIKINPLFSLVTYAMTQQTKAKTIKTFNRF